MEVEYAKSNLKTVFFLQIWVILSVEITKFVRAGQYWQELKGNNVFVWIKVVKQFVL